MSRTSAGGKKLEHVQYEVVAAPLCEAGFVGYVQATELLALPCEWLAGALARTLSADAVTGRAALLVNVPAGFERMSGFLGPSGSLDLVVLTGVVEFGATELHERDFAFVPADFELPSIRARRGAQLLLFVDPPPGDAESLRAQQSRGILVTGYDEQAWREASLVRTAGLELDLAVQLLKNDPGTTARTWYVRQGAGGKVPWERHSVVEEGFLIAGDYCLAERLPNRTVIGRYAPGGYFRRPPGVLHSGPRSGTESGAIWLQRAPAALDVTFLNE